MVSIELWSKNDGKAGSENKYDFPPPIDTCLYFGTCVLIRVDETESIVNLTTEVWNKAYEFLFGGFDDLDEEEEPSEDELEKIPQSMKTKHGYLKDGFVIDAPEDMDAEMDEDNESDFEDDDYDGDDDIVEKLAKPSNKKHSSTNKKEEEEDDDEDDLEGSELEEEDYEYSDE
jgi:hypothetical protein